MRLSQLWTSILVLLLVLGLIGCLDEQSSATLPTYYDLASPAHFPALEIPDDNPMSLEAVQLGQELFFDPLLSKDYSVSCSSCHLLSHAFADTLAISRGVHHDRPGNRNSYSLANVAYQKALFMEGGVPSLELQVLAPMGERSEMDLQIKDAVERMKLDTHYVALTDRAFGREIDPWVITRALAAYQRTLISADSPFDQYHYHGDEEAMSATAKEGWQLFNDKGCVACHPAPLFTDQGFHNIGLYAEYEDPGRGRLTDLPEDEGKFKTPSLRNVQVTGPYMHDGSISELEEVVAHFASGGVTHSNKSTVIQEFELDSLERKQLIAFLESLTDSTFISNRDFLPLSLR